MIIGVAGKARAGKDTIGKFIEDYMYSVYGRVFQRTAFAQLLKDMCMDNFGLTTEQLWGDKKEIPDNRFKKQIDGGDIGYWTPREIMQELGSFYRKIDGDFWIHALDKSIKEYKVRDVIITDVRHVNEFMYVKNNNGFLINIRRNHNNNIHGSSHISETALDIFSDADYDMVIENNGSLEDLERVAKNTVSVITSVENLTFNGGIQYGEK